MGEPDRRPSAEAPHPAPQPTYPSNVPDPVGSSTSHGAPGTEYFFFRLSINSTRGWWASGLGRDTLFTTVETCSANQLQNERIFSENESCKMRGNLFNPKTTLIHDVFLLPNKKIYSDTIYSSFLKECALTRREIGSISFSWHPHWPWPVGGKKTTTAWWLLISEDEKK